MPDVFVLHFGLDEVSVAIIERIRAMSYSLKLGPENRSANALTLLLVSPSEAVSKLIARAAAEIKASLNVAPEFAAAEEFLRRRRLDAVIVDFDLDAAGHFTASIRAGNSNKLAVIFACLSSAPQKQRALTAGANFVLQKPLSFEHVAEMLLAAREIMLRERRRYFRHPLYVPIAVMHDSQEHRLTTLNLSEGGAAIRVHHPFNAGTLVGFRFALPTGLDIEGRGEVVWSNDDGAIGLRFHSVKNEGKAHLMRWLEDQQEELPGHSPG